MSPCSSPQGAVDHSVAEATAGWMLALTHHMRTKDALVRTGDWDARSRYMGSELRDRTLGLVGFGGIGRAVVKVLTGFRMQTPLVYDPLYPAKRLPRLVVGKSHWRNCCVSQTLYLCIAR